MSETNENIQWPQVWPEDPTARAAYSANPGFMDGAEVSMPPASASLLARPEIAEALEQAHLDWNRRAKPGDVPVDLDLAVPGLEWLKENLAKESPLTRPVNRQYGILGEQKARRDEAEARRQESAAEFRAAQEAKRGGHTKSEARQALQTEADRQISGVVSGVQASFPNVSFQNFLELSGKLSPGEGQDGQVTIRERKGFQSAVSNRASQFLQEPSELINDMSGLILAMDFLNQGEHDNESPLASKYVETIAEALAGAVMAGTYDNLPEQLVDQWFSAIDAATSQAGEETAEGSGLPMEVVERVAINSGVLSNSLIAVAGKDPVGLIEGLHMFAKKGLDPGNQLRFNVTFNVIKKCLEEPLVGCEIRRGMRFTDSPELQQSATDIAKSLMTIGVEWKEIFHPDAMRKIGRKKLRLLISALVPKAPNGAVDQEAMRATQGLSVINQFSEQALTEEGRSTTVYGRLMDHLEKKGAILMSEKAPAGQFSARVVTAGGKSARIRGQVAHP